MTVTDQSSTSSPPPTSTTTPSPDVSPATPAGWSLLHLSPTIGTEVHGVDLREPLDAVQRDFLHQLMLERKVLFFRDQNITVEQHMDFCRNWGELEIIPFLPKHDQHPEVLDIRRGPDNRATENIWHSDVTWRALPSLGSALHAQVVPDVGGDTLFADMYAAYDGLPAALKRACEGLEAVHSIATSLSVYLDDDTMRAMLVEYPPQTHPVIRTHPETGRKGLYVNLAHTSHLVGMRREDSRSLLTLLAARANNPEYQCRFRWQKHSIAFWDNRACQHFACSDYFPQERHMHRVTVVGDQPF